MIVFSNQLIFLRKQKKLSALYSKLPSSSTPLN
ncbi:hypothetical protein vBEcoMWL3_gp168 [Escherichia phage vB_EcoM_WL-3]|nr:hypothetical protein vBEcoMWL3_gp168 [Escherichia phage vB_EcoM_WL-3]